MLGLIGFLKEESIDCTWQNNLQGLSLWTAHETRNNGAQNVDYNSDSKHAFSCKWQFIHVRVQSLAKIARS